MHICETVTCLSYVTSRTFSNSVLESSKQILVSGSVQQPFVSQQNLFIFLKKKTQNKTSFYMHTNNLIHIHEYKNALKILFLLLHLKYELQEQLLL